MATLRAMENRGRLDPDVGYWAEPWDPAGRLHPLYYTAHLAGRWVNVTTLPALYAAEPLFRLGGYRAALLVPMVGAVAAALAARALARRLGGTGGDGWLAFWVVGLASPVAVYALDFWEHSLGVALVAWAVVLLLDVAEGRAGWRAAAGAGLLVGAAATMRTEALVFGAVATAVACAAMLWRGRRLVPPVVAGLAVAVGLAVPLVANVALERATIGTALRTERAAGTVGLAVAGGGTSRLEEAALTGLGLQPAFGASSYLLGAGLLALLVLAARRSAQGEAGRPVARVAAGGAAALYLIRAADGLGFVPGLVAATPLAALGLVLPTRTGSGRVAGSGGEVARRRLVLAVALLALPLVWAFQFTGGAAPQWGGRYVLPSGLMLGVLGVLALPRMAPWARRGALGLAAAVTVFGLAWLSVRSHQVADAGAALARRPEPVLVSDVAFLLREEGWYAQGRHWLTAVTADDQRAAAGVVASAGFDRLGLVELDVGPARAHDLPGFAPGASSRVPFLSGVGLRVTTYDRVR